MRSPIWWCAGLLHKYTMSGQTQHNMLAGIVCLLVTSIHTVLRTSASPIGVLV